MKKKETKTRFEKLKKVEFYGYILDRLGKDTVTTSDIYSFINDAKQKFGVTRDDTKFYSAALNEFVSAIGNENIEIVVDDSVKWRGRGSSKIFSLRLKKGKETEDLEAMKAKIRGYFIKESGVKIVTPVVEKPEVKMVVEEKKPRKKCEFRRPKKNFLEKVIKVLVKAAAPESDDFLTYKTIREITGIDSFVLANLKAWKESLENVDILLDGMAITRFGEAGVYFGNPKGDLFSIAEMMKRLYSIDIKPNKLLGIGESVKSTSPVVKTEGTKELGHIDLTPGDYKKDNIMFSAAGILHYVGKVIETDVVCKMLNEHFSIMITKSELLELIKKEPEMVVLSYGSRLNLKDERTSWKVLREKYNPKRYKLDTIARIGASIEVVKEFVPGAELLSKITDQDGIYRLVYNRSYRSMLGLQKLYRTFRGSDMIFDKELVEEIRQQIEIIDGRANKDYIPYVLEKDI